MDRLSPYCRKKKFLLVWSFKVKNQKIVKNVQKCLMWRFQTALNPNISSSCWKEEAENTEYLTFVLVKLLHWLSELLPIHCIYCVSMHYFLFIWVLYSSLITAHLNFSNLPKILGINQLYPNLWIQPARDILNSLRSRRNFILFMLRCNILFSSKLWTVREQDRSSQHLQEVAEKAEQQWTDRNAVILLTHMERSNAINNENFPGSPTVLLMKPPLIRARRALSSMRTLSQQPNPPKKRSKTVERSSAPKPYSLADLLPVFVRRHNYLGYSWGELGRGETGSDWLVVKITNDLEKGTLILRYWWCFHECMHHLHMLTLPQGWLNGGFF